MEKDVGELLSPQYFQNAEKDLWNFFKKIKHLPPDGLKKVLPPKGELRQLRQTVEDLLKLYDRVKEAKIPCSAMASPDEAFAVSSDSVRMRGRMKGHSAQESPQCPLHGLYHPQ